MDLTCVFSDQGTELKIAESKIRELEGLIVAQRSEVQIFSSVFFSWFVFHRMEVSFCDCYDIQGTRQRLWQCGGNQRTVLTLADSSEVSRSNKTFSLRE